ncbi:hypothetical protein K7X08_019281 [Anisodus acutangulus]|uniref:Uncharacterized protein n=1 Tax=Anisodus acutangulus TaxID=402998 RepID=A0A9Q1RLV0_9SOLA|nr:hypothetical protein K7X08_019281 [Anisodus acutangulus]
MTSKHDALALGHQALYRLAYNTSQDPTTSSTEKLVDQDDVVADREPDAPQQICLAHRCLLLIHITRKFASSELLSFTDLSQRFTTDLPVFARHSSPTGRRLSFTDLHIPALMESTDRCNDFEENSVLTQLTLIMSNTDVTNDRLDESDSDGAFDHNGTDDEKSPEEGPDDFDFTRYDSLVQPALWDPKKSDFIKSVPLLKHLSLVVKASHIDRYSSLVPNSEGPISDAAAPARAG